MSDVTAPAESPKRRGRPPGSKNKPKVAEAEVKRVPLKAAEPKKWKLKAKPNWEGLDPDYAEDTPDRLGIDESIRPEGMSFQWVTNSVKGEMMGKHRAGFERNGWTPVHQEDFDGIFDGMWMPKGAPGEIEMEGLVLMTRPKEITKKFKAADKDRALEAVRIKERALRGGDLPGVAFDTNHPTVSIKVNKTMERIEVPKD